LLLIDLGIDFFRHAIINDTAWDYSTINFSTIALADRINPGGINAYDPDLRLFQSAGNKVIEYHGYQDPVIPSLASGEWYDKVYEFYGGLGKVNEVSDFYRLFMVPGMQHCRGGDGGMIYSHLFPLNLNSGRILMINLNIAWVSGSASQSGYLPSSNATSHSLLWSLVDWVENSDSSGPEMMVGTKYVDDLVSAGVAFTRPYCRWPNVPVWNGAGDFDSEESWSCPTAGVY
jgi:feruloyl esterase